MKRTTLVPQEWWDQQYQKYELQIINKDDWLRQWFESVVPPVALKGSKSCLEIGCYPGRYLAAIGQMGYKVNGLDLTPGIEEKLPLWLQQQGVSIGEFCREDFQSYDKTKKFDLVYSIGFLEHFLDWKSVVKQHTELVGPRGYLILTAPNFSGAIQWLLHRWLDNENLSRHNTAAMNPHKWAEVVKAQGFEILHAGYTGGFLFWVDQKQRNSVQRAVIRFISRWQKRRIRTLNYNGNPAWAPYCTLVAKRP